MTQKRIEENTMQMGYVSWGRGECWLMTQGWPKVFEQKGKETLQYDIMCRKKVGRNTQTESVDAYNLSQQTRRTCSMAYGRAATTP